MAPHSSTLAWKIPWTEEPGRLQSMGSRSRTRLSDFTFTFHFHALKEMATHSSVPAWVFYKGFPCGSDGKASAHNVGDPGLIPGLGRSPEEGNGNSTPVFLPDKFHGPRSLVGYSPWDRKESDATSLFLST